MTELAEINMTPMVDVMLVLLIIFMVTMPFVYQSVDVSVPELNTEQTQQQSSHQVKITLSGELYIDNMLTSRLQLQRQLKHLAQLKLKPDININADKQVSYQQLIELMVLIQSSGLERIQFVTPISTSSN
ncbi:MAG: biopolymer transporter ExbD [Colwellia sp.]|nr:biopolymer transporter ExbD [Colwellia sp.]